MEHFFQAAWSVQGEQVSLSDLSLYSSTAESVISVQKEELTVVLSYLP
jgi:hypothetical protein